MQLSAFASYGFVPVALYRWLECLRSLLGSVIHSAAVVSLVFISLHLLSKELEASKVGALGTEIKLRAKFKPCDVLSKKSVSYKSEHL